MANSFSLAVFDSTWKAVLILERRKGGLCYDRNCKRLFLKRLLIINVEKSFFVFCFIAVLFFFSIFREKISYGFLKIGKISYKYPRFDWRLEHFIHKTPFRGSPLKCQETRKNDEPFLFGNLRIWWVLKISS